MRPYESLLKSRRQALHRRAAEVLRDEPERAAAEPEVIAHHFTEAGFDDPAIEWWARRATRRSAAPPSRRRSPISAKAIAMADKGDGGKAAGASRQGQKLHVAYGNALLQARGMSALETTEAFAKARESSDVEEDAPERLAADYGLWGRQLGPRRAAGGESLRRSSARWRRGETRFAGGRPRSPHDGNHPFLRRRVSPSARSPGTRARPIPAWT
jgi:hypothetical protein